MFSIFFCGKNFAKKFTNFFCVKTLVEVSSSGYKWVEMGWDELKLEENGIFLLEKVKVG